MLNMKISGLMSSAFVLGCLLCASNAPAADNDRGFTAPAHEQMTDDGLILVTKTGMTLYTFVADGGTPGKSQCTNVPHPFYQDPTAGFGAVPLPKAETHKSCAQKWPPFVADEHATGDGDWSIIDRSEHIRQWAYRGHPLYTSIKDHVPGDRNGAVIIGQVGRGFTLAAAPLDFPPGLKLIRHEEGLVLATLNGRPVYTHRPGAQKTCDGCDELLQPITAPAVSRVSGRWSIVSAGAGRRQYAFEHQTLFSSPIGLTDREIAESNAWELVVFRKAPALPADIRTHLSLLGDVYADKEGRTLYAFTCGTPAGDAVRCDDPGDAAQYWVMLCGDANECARRWRPYEASAHAQPAGDWSVVQVAYPMFTDKTGFTYPADAPRVRAWAYRGMPAYTYYEDKTAGDIWGDGVRLFSFSGFYALQIPGRGLLD
jgi:predicted lipoprotein with Yx(FWY)xxD motif